MAKTKKKLRLKHRPGDDPSCVSLQSNKSKHLIINFKRDPENPRPRGSPGLSGASVSSDRSKEWGIGFERHSVNRGLSAISGSDSDLSHVSLRSDSSKEWGIEFKRNSLNQGLSAFCGSDPGPSSVSARSDRSKEWGIGFKRKIVTSVSRSRNKPTLRGRPDDDPSSVPQRSPMFKRDSDNYVPSASLGSDPGLSSQSVRSDQSKEWRIERKRKRLCPEHPREDPQAQLDHVFMLLQEEILTLVKNHLKNFHMVLTSDHPERLDNEENEKHSSKEAFLQITLNVLRGMKQEQLAERLHSKISTGVSQDKLKMQLQQKFIHVSEGIAKGNPTFLNHIYTDLYITKGEFNQEHETCNIETFFKSPTAPEITITCEDLFKSPAHTPEQPIREEMTEEPVRAEQTEERGPIKSRLKRVLGHPKSADLTNRPIRTVVTKGVAGIGKTVLTHKFSLDWAEGKTNQNIHLLFPFTFRQINVLREREFSLVGLLHHFFGESAKSCYFDQLHVLFIFDGLDECRLPLDFSQTQVLTDPTESVSLDVLLVNLIRGTLLPSARLWITTRPAAANQIPTEFISLVTEVRGFADPQKEQYFRKRFEDEQQATAVISHIKSSCLLFSMCYIPIFCWILSTVLYHVMEMGAIDQLPQTLSQMYIHFLVVQAKVKSLKYDVGSETDAHWTPETRKMVLSLGKLAFEQLQKGNLIFYESDLRECGLDSSAASVYSGVFTQVFREEPGLYQDKVYCFIHLSVQEFLAALFVHMTFFDSGIDLLSTQEINESSDSDDDEPEDVSESETHITSEEVFYRSGVDLALKSPNGHLDLFLRFLLGLSLLSNQRLLHGLLTPTGSSSQTHQSTVKYLKNKLNKGVSQEKSLNLIHCLNELNDRSLVEQIQEKMREGRLFSRNVSPAEWSAVVFILLSPGSDLEEFDLRKYQASDTAFRGLLPVLKASSKITLSGCNLSVDSCGSLSSVLSSSNLTHLDLSNNKLQDSGVQLLCSGLKSPTCRLKTLSLSGCNLSKDSCGSLSLVLSSSKLTRLDLSNNHLEELRVELLCSALKTPMCRVDTLSLSGCNLSVNSCGSLSSVLSSSNLTNLDLSNNDLQDSGVELLCSGLESAACRLETLILSGCLVSERGASYLASSLRSAQSCLKDLDLSYNHPGASAVLLTSVWDTPLCNHETLRLDPAGEQWMVPGLRKYSCEFSLDPNTAYSDLQLSEDQHSVKCVWVEQAYPHHPDRFRDQPQVLSSTGLTGRCYWEVEWSGMWGVDIAMSYRAIKRPEDCRFGDNDQSWALRIVRGQYSFHHNKRQTTVSHLGSSSGRVGVFLDSEAGFLSFYQVFSDGELSHLHTFTATFTEPLFPGFGLGPPGSSVSLVKLKNGAFSPWMSEPFLDLDIDLSDFLF